MCSLGLLPGWQWLIFVGLAGPQLQQPVSIRGLIRVPGLESTLKPDSAPVWGFKADSPMLDGAARRA
jgi:hypothetical protein